MRKDAGVDGDAQRIQPARLDVLPENLRRPRKRNGTDCDDEYKSPLPERCAGAPGPADPEGITGDELLDFVNNDLFPALKTLHATADQAPRAVVVHDVFEDANNYMKSGT